MSDDPLQQYLDSKAAPAGDSADPLVAYLGGKSQGPSSASMRERLIAAHEGTKKKLEKLQADGGRDSTLETMAASFSPSEFARDTAQAIGTGATNWTDAISGGLYSKARNAIGNRVAPEATAENQAREDQFNAEHPIYQGTMKGLAYSTPVGLPGMAAKTGSAVAEAVGGAARPVISSIAGGAAAGASMSGTESALRGDPMHDVGWNMVKDALAGGAVGGILGSVVKGANWVMKSRGAQARELINRHGGTVSPISSGKGGPFEAELAGLDANDRGIGEAARKGAEKTIEGIDTRFEAGAGKPYAALRGAADRSPGASKLVDATDVYQQLMKSFNGERLTPPERANVAATMKNIEERYMKPTGQVLMPNDRLNELREQLFSSGGAGDLSPSSVKDVQFLKAADMAKAHVDQGPYAKANQVYKQGSTQRDEARKLLNLKPNAGTDDTGKLAVTLARNGQNTTTTGYRNAGVEPFKKQNPDLADSLELPEVMRAKADLEFHGLGQRGHGGLIARLPAGMGVGAGAMAATMSHEPRVAMLAFAAELASKNIDPITGRLLYTPARIAEQWLANNPETVTAISQNPILRASEEAKRKAKRRAEALLGLDD